MCVCRCVCEIIKGLRRIIFKCIPHPIKKQNKNKQTTTTITTTKQTKQNKQLNKKANKQNEKASSLHNIAFVIIRHAFVQKMVRKIHIAVIVCYFC